MVRPISIYARAPSISKPSPARTSTRSTPTTEGTNRTSMSTLGIWRRQTANSMKNSIEKDTSQDGKLLR